MFVHPEKMGISLFNCFKYLLKGDVFWLHCQVSTAHSRFYSNDIRLLKRRNDFSYVHCIYSGGICQNLRCYFFFVFIFFYVKQNVDCC